VLRVRDRHRVGDRLLGRRPGAVEPAQEETGRGGARRPPRRPRSRIGGRCSPAQHGEQARLTRLFTKCRRTIHLAIFERSNIDPVFPCSRLDLSIPTFLHKSGLFRSVLRCVGQDAEEGVGDSTADEDAVDDRDGGANGGAASGPGSVGGACASWVSAVAVCRGTDLLVSCCPIT